MKDGELTVSGTSLKPLSYWNPQYLSQLARLKYREREYYSVQYGSMNVFVSVVHSYYGCRLLSIIALPNKPLSVFDKYYYSCPDMTAKPHYGNFAMEGISIQNIDTKYKEIEVFMSEDSRKFNASLSFFKKSQEIAEIHLLSDSPSEYLYSVKSSNYLVSGQFVLDETIKHLPQAIGIASWERGVWPYTFAQRNAFAVTSKDNEHLGFHLSQTHQTSALSSPDTLFVGRDVFKLGNAIFYENHKGNMKIRSANFKPTDKFGAFYGNFFPLVNHTYDYNWVMSKRAEVTYYGVFNLNFTFLDRSMQVSTYGYFEEIKGRW